MVVTRARNVASSQLQSHTPLLRIAWRRLFRTVIVLMWRARAAASAAPSETTTTLPPATLALALALATRALAAPVLHHRRRAVLLDNVLHKAPNNDGDASLAVLLTDGKRVHAVLPIDVNVATKRERHAILLREIDTLSVVSVQEGELALGTEGDADSDVLRAGALRIEGGAVVMERLVFFCVFSLTLRVLACFRMLLCPFRHVLSFV